MSVGRNELCPCGSRIKFKKCCMNKDLNNEDNNKINDNNKEVHNLVKERLINPDLIDSELIEEINYVVEDKSISFLNQFGSVRSKMWDPQKIDNKTISNLVDLFIKIIYLNTLYSNKIIYLCESLKNNIKDNNVVVITILARSMLEHLGSKCFILQELKKLQKKLKNIHLEKKCLEHINQMAKVVNKNYYGGQEFGKYGYSKVDVMDLIRSLDKYTDTNYTQKYAMLSEATHPNYLSNKLISEGIIGEGEINNEKIFNEVLFTVKINLIGILDTLKKIEEDLHEVIYDLSDYILISEIENYNISRIFEQKKAKIEGDGKSKKTAIAFINARTKREYHKMMSTFFKENNIEIEMQNFQGIENNYVYDLIKTDKNEIWFKQSISLKNIFDI